MYYVRHWRRIPKLDYLQGEIRKIKTPPFDEEHRKGDYSEVSLLGMRKYF